MKRKEKNINTWNELEKQALSIFDGINNTIKEIGNIMFPVLNKVKIQNKITSKVINNVRKVNDTISKLTSFNDNKDKILDAKDFIPI